MSKKVFEERLLNDGWSFAKLPAGSELAGALAADWQPVDLPHDWLIRQAEDLYETADAWYRRTLTYGEAASARTLIRFDGVYMDCDVLLNGEVVCTHPYGYTAFDAELTGKLKRGKNEMMVHIRHQSLNTRWYSGSGIFRDVTLVRLPERHLIPDGITTKTIRRKRGWGLEVVAETRGEGKLQGILKDKWGRRIAAAEGKAEHGQAKLILNIPVGHPWSPEDPYLYRLELCFGEQTKTLRIGLRETRFDPNSGFWINGKNTKMKGVCLHHDLGALGSAFHVKAARRQLRLMKDMGVNALRTSHNPPATQVLDLCDEMGFLVIDEAFDMWERPKTPYDYARFFPEWYKKDVASWVRRDRNHACVVMWSIGNEISDTCADERGYEVAGMLAREVRRHDKARHGEVTFGSNYMGTPNGERCGETVGVVGYNYGEKLYDDHHRKHPDWVIYGSETESIVFSRGVYHFPASATVLSEADLQCSSLLNSTTSWGAPNLFAMITEDLNNPYSCGQFIWTGTDYIGEPTPYHTRSSYFGQADTAGFPKDPYYLFQSLWSDRTMIHIGVNWDWNEGQLIDVRVMTSCAACELFLNGESLGRQRLNHRDAAKCAGYWQVPFRKGELLAVGYDEGGNELCRDVRRTSGNTDRLCLRAEDEVLLGDGNDMTFITVTAADEDGNPVENARDRVFVSVSGGARLLGMDNGDPADPDGYRTDSKRLFGGKLLIIAGSTGEDGDAVIRVENGEGKVTELRIPVKKAAKKPGTSCVERIPAGKNPGAYGDRIPVRRLEILPQGSRSLTPENPEVSFRWRIQPENADLTGITWQVTNEVGIVTPCAALSEDGDAVTVRGLGDGTHYLRALYGNSEDHPELISQMEIHVSGMGKPGLDPYSFIAGGLYDYHEGQVGPGNDKGFCSMREGTTTVGFTGLDFGEAGSDTLTMPIFALDGQLYRMELFDGIPGQGGRLLTVLEYQKPSIWNVYQEETWKLPEALRGIHTLCFRMERKFHVKGLIFAKQSRAFHAQKASDADVLFGDSFRREGSAVKDIGNNVSLTWNNMDFGEGGEVTLAVNGRTENEVNPVSLRMLGDSGESREEILSFRGGEAGEQRFRVKVPAGNTRVSLVFLPGSRFDLEGFRFIKD